MAARIGAWTTHLHSHFALPIDLALLHRPALRSHTWLTRLLPPSLTSRTPAARWCSSGTSATCTGTSSA